MYCTINLLRNIRDGFDNIINLFFGAVICEN